MLAACKGDPSTTTFVISPDAGSVAGYVGGTPVTLVDGTPVTLPDGSPVTTPELKDKDGNPITTRAGSTGGTTATSRPRRQHEQHGFVQPTGTTVVTVEAEHVQARVPEAGHLRVPRNAHTGRRRHTEADATFVYNLTSPDQHQIIRWQLSDAAGTSDRRVSTTRSRTSPTACG